MCPTTALRFGASIFSVLPLSLGRVILLFGNAPTANPGGRPRVGPYGGVRRGAGGLGAVSGAQSGWQRQYFDSNELERESSARALEDAPRAGMELTLRRRRQVVNSIPPHRWCRQSRIRCRARCEHGSALVVSRC